MARSTVPRPAWTSPAQAPASAKVSVHPARGKASSIAVSSEKRAAGTPAP